MEKLKEFFSKKEVTLGGYLLPTKWFYWTGGLLLAFVLIPGLIGMGRSLYWNARGLGGYAASQPEMMSLDSDGGADYNYAYDDAAYAEEAFYDGDFADEKGLAAPVSSDVVSVSNNSGTNAAPVSPVERMIVYSGYLYMAVESPEETRVDIQALVDEFSSRGAFLVSANQSGNGSNLYISMSIRVPSEHFGSIMQKFADMGVEVNERNENASDVTEEFVDLENRIESMEAARDRLLQIMQNADTTEDLLYAEQQLTYRETEIESLKGRLQYLSSAASLSRIDLTLTPYIVSQPIDTTWDPMKAIRWAIDDLIDNFQGFIEFFINFIIVGIPALAAWVFMLWLAWLVIRFVWRNTFGRSKKTEPEMSEE